MAISNDFTENLHLRSNVTYIASWEVLSDQEFKYVMCDIKRMPEQLESINPIVINVSRVINKVFESHIDKRKDDLNEVMVVTLFYS